MALFDIWLFSAHTVLAAVQSACLRNLTTAGDQEEVSGALAVGVGAVDVKGVQLETDLQEESTR